MNANKVKKVIYDPQGMLKAAAAHFDWLLVLDEALVQKFFIAMAVEQPDGTLLLPEGIRSKVSVEVVYEDVPVKPTPPFEVDIFAAIPSIYDSPKTDSPISESIDLPIGYADEVDYLSHFEAVTQGEFELAVVDRIIVDDLSG
jgi:hypothetical protein